MVVTIHHGDHHDPRIIYIHNNKDNNVIEISSGECVEINIEEDIAYLFCLNPNVSEVTENSHVSEVSETPEVTDVTENNQ